MMRHTGIRGKQIPAVRDTGAPFFDRFSWNVETVRRFKDVFRDAHAQQVDGCGVFSHLIDGQHAVQEQLGFGVGELREHEAWAVTEDQGRIRQVDGLNVLGFARGRRDADFLAAQQSVDRARLAYVGIPYQTDSGLLSFFCC